MAKKSSVNYTSRPVPSTPGANQVTNMDLEYKKGGSTVSSKMPKKNVIKGGK